MKKIWIGLLLVFFNFNLGSFDILPDYVGYALIYLGMGEVRESEIFAQRRTLCLGAMALSLAVQLAALLGIESWLLGLIATVVSYVTLYLITAGVRELEEQGLAKNARQMMLCFVVAVVVMASMLLIPLVLITVIVLLAAQVMYLYYFYGAYKTYRAAHDNINETDAEEPTTAQETTVQPEETTTE